MKTARFTLDQNRLLAAPVPPDGEADLDANSGTLELLGRGVPAAGEKNWTTTPVTSRDDLRSLLAAAPSI
jgi:hypothetical protein